VSDRQNRKTILSFYIECQLGGNVNVIKQITVSRGEVVGIGKVKIPRTQDFDYEIQMLSFLVIKGSENSFVSTCIHLQMDGYGRTPRESINDMIENISCFLKENFEKLPIDDAWNNLEDLFKCDEWSTELWNAYHSVQIQLSMYGRSTDSVENLRKRIVQLEKRVKQLESLEARTINKEISDVAEDLIVDYTPVNEAA
jgi:hypothetical protein